MNTDRPFPVVVDPRLLDELEPYVRIVIDLAIGSHARQNQASAQVSPIDDLEELLRCWGNLGFLAAMPSEGLFRLSQGRREEVFASCGFRLSVLHKKNDRRLEWLVQYDGLSEGWLDVLLNCLEGFHVKVAPIARVALTTELENESGANSNEDVESGSRTVPPESRPRRWWPFGRS